MTEVERTSLRAAAALPDDTIDTGDIPETRPEDWDSAEIGKFYRPRKSQLTLRLDTTVVDWFRRHAEDGRGYQTDINQALRDHIAAVEKKLR